MTDDEVKQELCRRLIEGQSMRTICATEGMRDKATICRWLAADEDFQRQYAIARAMQAEALADELLDIADTPIIGTKTITKADGSVESVTGDMLEHRRLQVDARKWVASKLQPRKYGEAALIKHADSEGNRLVQLDDTDRMTQLANILTSVASRAEKVLSDDR